MGKTTKIIDQFTDLPISRQRKWQLRHPEKWKAYTNKQNKTITRIISWRNAAKRYYYRNWEFQQERNRQNKIKMQLGL